MRQYQSFRQSLAPNGWLSGSLGDVDTPMYRSADGSKEIISKKQFYGKFGVEPGEEYLVGAPDYSKPLRTGDAKMGVDSLPHIQKKLFLNMSDLKNKRDVGRPAPGMLPMPSLPSATDVPVEIVIDPPPPPPIPNINAQQCVAGDCSVRGSSSASASPSAFAESIAYGGAGGNSVAYGGQSIVNITNTPGYSPSDQDSGAGDTPVGFLSMIRPNNQGDWVKLIVGFAAGWFAAKWVEKNRRLS